MKEVYPGPSNIKGRYFKGDNYLWGKGLSFAIELTALIIACIDNDSTCRKLACQYQVIKLY